MTHKRWLVKKKKKKKKKFEIGKCVIQDLKDNSNSDLNYASYYILPLAVVTKYELPLKGINESMVC